ncbi:hypothetical protein H072_6237 [Dactylellina haptotyla CBS 200.50]|uniref:Uncharacterized protein n=1 Tax=Dactylellina haptotyla (strain CBS 200.50) TaxID=1284197 RepID=S8BKQ9_DACHA|nr:hypothetical protein H072_6237 [Dactylellina haptotyla CBS 200.50]
MPSVTTRIRTGVTGTTAVIFILLPYTLGAGRSVAVVSACIGVAIFFGDHVYDKLDFDASNPTVSATTILTILPDPLTMRPTVVINIFYNPVWAATTTTLGAMVTRGGVQ